MAAFAAIVQSIERFLFPPSRPYRVVTAHHIRLVPAALAGAAGGFAFLVVYYATLAFLPPATAYPVTEYPVSAWAHRFDLSQFAGSLLRPPLPTAATWWLGLAVLFGTFIALGVVYAVLLSWSLQSSDTRKGIGYGVALFFGLAFLITLANGFQPAMMRNALPDTGLLLLGWTGWATVQLFLAHLLYGAILGRLYRRWA